MIPRKASDLNIGDTFTNSFGYKTTIIARYNEFKFTLKSNSKQGTEWEKDIKDILELFKEGRYTNYKSIKNNINGLILTINK